MSDRTYKFSVNNRLINKNQKKDLLAFKEGFKNIDANSDILQGMVYKGYAISYQFSDSPRNTNNFECTDIVCVDVDENRTLEETLSDPFVKKYALFIYTTFNHTLDVNRFRIVFGLQETVTDALTVKALTTALSIKLCGDLKAIDGARIYYGSSNCAISSIGGELPSELCKELIELGLERIRAPFTTGFAGGSKVTSTSKRQISPLNFIKTATNNEVRIGSIAKNTSVFCPDHFDKSPSAFVDISQTSNSLFLRCRVCQTTRWVSNQNSRFYDFNGFDNEVFRIKKQGKESISTEMTLFGEISKKTLNASNIFLSETNKLVIKKLDQGIMFIKSPKGSGKTSILPEIIGPFLKTPKIGTLSLEEYEHISSDTDARPLRFDGETNFSVLLIGHRQALIREMCKKIDLNCYLDYENIFTKNNYELQINSRQRLHNAQKRYGICLDSLPKLQRQSYNLVILDESEQVLAHFMSETMSGKREHIFKKFGQLLKHSDRIICLDADLSWITFNTICELGNARSKDYSEAKKKNKKPSIKEGQLVTDSKKVSLYINSFNKKDIDIQLFASKQHLIGDLYNHLILDKRIFVTSNSKNIINQLSAYIEKEIPQLKIISITSDNSSTKDIQHFIMNIKTEILKYDAVLTSPSLSTGIDITFEDESRLVDIVYGFFENKVTNHFEIDQQICRVRHPKEIKMWINPQTFIFETDIATIKDDLLSDNLIANTYIGFNPVTFEDIYNGEDPLLRLASLVASRSRASMNHLRKNFVQYKQEQGITVNYVEKDNDIFLTGKDLISIGKDLTNENIIQSILNAKPIDQSTFIKISESEESEFEVTEDLRFSYTKALIEFFFRQPINESDIKLHQKGTKQKIILFTDLLKQKGLSTPSKDSFKDYDRLAREKILKKIATDYPGLSSIKEYKVQPILLQLIFSTTPLFKKSNFIVDKEVTLSDFDEFISFVNKYKSIIELQLTAIRKDISTKPVTQFGEFLKLVNLKVKKTRVDQSNNDKKYFYEIDKELFDLNLSIIERRKVFDNRSYIPIYWEKVHQENGFDSPVFEKIEDFDGFSAYPKTIWTPKAQNPPKFVQKKTQNP